LRCRFDILCGNFGRCSARFAQIFRAQPMTRHSSNVASNGRVGGNRRPRPELFDTKPQHARTRADCPLLPRNKEAPPVILHATKETQFEREQNIR